MAPNLSQSLKEIQNSEKSIEIYSLQPGVISEPNQDILDKSTVQESYKEHLVQVDHFQESKYLFAYGSVMEENKSYMTGNFDCRHVSSDALHPPGGTRISNLAPSPGVPVSVMPIPVRFRISRTRKRP